MPGHWHSAESRAIVRHVAERYSKKGPDLLGQTSKVQWLGFGDLFLPVCMHKRFAHVSLFLTHEWEQVKSDVLQMSIKMHNNMRIHVFIPVPRMCM